MNLQQLLKLLTFGTSNAPAAGYMGEPLLQQRLSSSPLSITTLTWTDITSSPITLTPGRWYCTGSVTYTPAATTRVSLLAAGVSLSVAPSPGGIDAEIGGMQQVWPSPGAVLNGGWTCTFSPRTIGVDANTSLYLRGISIFDTSTLTAYGHMQAFRLPDAA